MGPQLKEFRTAILANINVIWEQGVGRMTPNEWED